MIVKPVAFPIFPVRTHIVKSIDMTDTILHSTTLHNKIFLLIKSFNFMDSFPIRAYKLNIIIISSANCFKVHPPCFLLFAQCMVPREGLEPSIPIGRRILSPLRIPIPPPRHSVLLNIFANCDLFTLRDRDEYIN